MPQDTTNWYSIYITAANPSNGELTLSDNGETDIQDHGYTYDGIFWVVNDDVPHIAAITGIGFEDGTNLFSENGPAAHPSTSKSCWYALFTVGSSPVGAYEDYKIYWTDVDGNPQTHDPRIVINS